VVMGVSGSGKSTIGALLAERLGWRYAEGDDFHPAANRTKMAAGVPLDDADRRPWLTAIGVWMDEMTAAGQPGVVSCSALHRSYRDLLRAGRPNVSVIYLDADQDVIAARLAQRSGHFFPPKLLASQFRELEPPMPDEGALHVVVDDEPAVIADRILADFHRPSNSPSPAVGGEQAGPPR
jgi:gluconokinase